MSVRRIGRLLLVPLHLFIGLNAGEIAPLVEPTGAIISTETKKV
jgi:hypothetical protein